MSVIAQSLDIASGGVIWTRYGEVGTLVDKLWAQIIRISSIFLDREQGTDQAMHGPTEALRAPVTGEEESTQSSDSKETTCLRNEICINFAYSRRQVDLTPNNESRSLQTLDIRGCTDVKGVSKAEKA